MKVMKSFVKKKSVKYFEDIYRAAKEKKKKKKKKRENNCRDPGLFRAHASSPDLNQGPSDLQSDALPTELSRRLEVLEAKL